MSEPVGEAPPSYEVATAGSSKAPSGIPPDTRRSMEDETRPLPQGWVRQYDPKSHHQFFVDTTKEPPRRIWHHPYDDEEYLSTLPVEESRKITRKVLTDSGMDEAGIKRIETDKDEEPPKGLRKYARHVKDRITKTTHEEREAARAKKAEEAKEHQEKLRIEREKMLEESRKYRERQREEENRAYEAHLAFRQAFSRAVETGQPQFVGKDRDGHDVYVEPPYGPQAPQGARGYNPYSQGPYTNPNARFIRPEDEYQRPMGYGYGSGLGLPLLGGVAGGLLLGSLFSF